MTAFAPHYLTERVGDSIHQALWDAWGVPHDEDQLWYATERIVDARTHRLGDSLSRRLA